MPKLEDLPDLQTLPLPGFVKKALLSDQAEEAHDHATSTEPQGTQFHATGHEHEQEDVEVRPILVWMGWLGVMVVAVMILCGAAYPVLEGMMKAQDPPAGSIALIREKPPLPRLLPNPIDNADGGPLPTPIDTYQVEKANEEAALEKLGLWDRKAGVATIPADVLRSLAPAPDHDHPAEGMPSDASGGFTTEDRLK